MQLIRFQAQVKNGIVHIPKKYDFLSQQKSVDFVVVPKEKPD
jgi:hypothetical protein